MNTIFYKQRYQPRKIKKLSKLQSVFFGYKDFSKDYVNINQVVQNATFRKIRDIIPTTKNWKRNKRYVK